MIASNLESRAIRLVKSNSVDLAPVLSRLRNNFKEDYTDDIAYDIINALESLFESGFQEKTLSFGKDVLCGCLMRIILQLNLCCLEQILLRLLFLKL